MRVLVTGATGFLGAHVVEACRQAGHEVRGLVRPGRPREHVEALGVELAEGDLLEEGTLRAACRGVDGVIHCAARTGYWSRQNEVQRRVTVEGTSTLLRAARQARVERFVHVSSIAAVGANRDGALLDESSPWIGDRALRVHYGLCKREAEERALAAAKGGQPVTVVNPTMLCGPRLDGDGPSGMVRQVAAGMRWVQAGGVSAADVADVADGCRAALERGSVGERYVLGGHNVSWHSFYGALAARVGAAPPERVVPGAAARALVLGASVLDALGLSRPPWTPEIFRTWGWYTFASSAKAERWLEYRIRPFEEIVTRMVGSAALPCP